ncbi:putative Clan CD, family C14, metacaspase-like cysteine peptidase [Monocercomonoides exilis]|uniref:putative Clan CD, family C14, metacaspase-like cysteine peptidase n=1 Tax=Monocercomonoides exilis TaxID=2049356 RepID=UPI003559C220|nr:putative Clan CD, family C14, metacaspase-like cysteine peptidase [Monocercomonoides exilis]|eukprot:MONOS_7211.1-p1 / transcript=MONOS_7211.1 / gene=MONOS_7211 / organism=Monocercomonoides_exilis_PA203 / gene_product=Clan CD, family C14, metacaspase-like cysteine peptidase / transcript_product=Clan CD, family C14, metacaspase-like cysteine peptidase / location=Mono_scaffold00241:32742-35664(+) / protein_length=948 / sequence_SO=supercontig / SO=protein_coding / is_pseudo=false
MEKIKVTLLSGKGLAPARQAAVCDPFCVVKLGTQKYISTTKVGVNPTWNEGFIFNMPSSNPILHIDVMTKDRIKVTYSVKLDSVDLDLSPFLNSLPSTNVIRLKSGSLTVIIDSADSSSHFGNTKLPSQALQATQVMPIASGSKTSGLSSSTHGSSSMGPTKPYPTQTVQSATNPKYSSSQSQFAPPSSSKKPSSTAASCSSTPSSGSKWGSGSSSSSVSSSAASVGGGKMGMWTNQASGKIGGGAWQYLHRPHGPHCHHHHMKPPKQAQEDFAKYDNTFSKLDEEEAWVPPTALPETYEETETEKLEKMKRWAKFATFMSKPYEYDSKYKKSLQQLDAMGAINLERIKREQIPSITINYCAALFFNPYEDLPHTLDMGPINDALLMAELFISRGYRVVYLCDATPREYLRWMDWLLSNVETEFVSFFSGHGTQIPDTTGKEADGMSEVLVFYDETRKKQAKGGAVPKLKAIEGVTEETISDTVLYKLITNKEYAQTRVVLLTDCCHSGTMFNMDQKPENGKLSRPPPCVVCVGSAVDSQTAKQTMLQGKETGIFTYNFVELLKKKPAATFLELQSYMASAIKKYQTIQLTSMNEDLYKDQIVVTLEKGEGELQLEDIDSTILEDPPESITSIPDEDIPSQAEQEIAALRWADFCAELAKPAPYNSKYKKYLQQLDAMGAINLERITRDQIPPNIYINHCAALFINPYEDLPHTLESGPLGDAVLMSELFLSRGYHVVYFCDATPHEYYRWMDWLLDNVETELVSFFSGHGTQVPDTTGKEADGLSEVLVFYDSTRKKKATGANVPKISPVQGITNETVDDTCMFDLITSKEYPQTRVVLLTDCCHSGTMFNFDQSLPKDAHGLTPPMNVVCVGSAQDSQTAKQTVFEGTEAGVFTYNFNKLLKQKPHSTFLELQSYMDKQIKKYQTIQLTGSSPDLYAQPIIVDNEE